ncbi:MULTISPECIES: SAM-dependent methyltransferase [unclassified Vibrio]|uniref:SAM-dependent methyltransferase n=1 Tax=unclassified Vibrio TaxID=2614977 RepID=UPI0013615417|nr:MULTISPECIES: methyltransferase domain-containing protein [unclassified Vibrio]NAW57121.1 methyltransferase domain-containing protein [Vibrio sp. V36_P2S2PM302]NAX24584.1 methyltransferase domain-containing protein [Vibrio sp. V38_P2S17PM301]NAX28699.1 methyltransferase domain-containing protein [Vibrio sp. V37_P2S8PM304]
MMFNCPLSAEKAQELIAHLGLEYQHRVVDIGCGQGEFLFQIHQKTQANCLGLDMQPNEIAVANNKVAQHPDAAIRFLATDVKYAELESGAYKLAVCLGSTHAFGEGEMAYPDALTNMADLVGENGLILVGEPYWKQAPAKEYLDFIGEPVGVYRSHEQNIQVAEALGLIPVYVRCSHQDEWDSFEWGFRYKAEQEALAEPGNSERKQKLASVREWNRHYRLYGRETMGFGFYLYLKP